MKILANYITIGFSFLFMFSCAGNKSAQENNIEYPSYALTNTTWGLSELNGQKITPTEKNKQAYIILDDEGKLKGYMGCNRVMGTYEHDNKTITFGSLASSKLMCPEMQTEDMLLLALDKTVDYTIKNNELILKKADHTVAIFEVIP